MKETTKWRRAGCFFILFCLLVLGEAGAMWDGYIPPSDEAAMLTIVDMDNSGVILNAGAAPSKKHLKNAKFSASWNHGAVKTIQFLDVPSDWTDYTILEFWMYCEKQTDSNFMLIIDTQQTEAGIPYFSATLKTDWVGWKQFRFSLSSDLTVVRNADWRAVTGVRFVVEGWNLVANPETQLYLDSMYLTGSASEGSLYSIYELDEISEAQSLMEGAVGIYGDCEQVYAEGAVSPLEEGTAVVRQDSKTYATLSFFETYLGAQIQREGQTAILTLGEKSWQGPILFIGEEAYLEVAAAAGGLGKNVYERRKLTVISDSTDIFLLEDNRRLREIIEYEITYKKFDSHSATDADFETAKDNWRYYLVGNEENDLSNQYLMEKVQSVETTGRSAWESMKKGQDRPALWKDQVPVTTGEMSQEYAQVRNMALAYGTYGCALYKNEALKEDILYALEWLYQHRYGENEKNGAGWKSTADYNWYDWQIQTPTYLIDSLMIMEEELSAQQISRYLSLFDYLVPRPRDSGMNKLSFSRLIVGSGLLQKDVEKVATGRIGGEELYIYTDEGEGFYTDGTHISHGKHPMNGTYGYGSWSSIIDNVNVLQGTAFEITNPNVYNLVDWTKEAFLPLIYKGSFMRMMMGRSSLSAHDAGRMIVAKIMDMLHFAEEEDRREIEAAVKYQVQQDTAVNYYDGMGIVQVQQLMNIMEDESITPREEYLLNKVYYRGDSIVHQREDFAVAVAMSSSRIYNYESINSENTTGWYLRDGMVYVYNDDLNQYDSVYWSNVDPYRMPGTTVDTQEREAASIAMGNEYLSSQDFVGGVSLDDTYGAGAMQLEAYHSDGVPVNTESIVEGYGGAPPAHNSTLQAKKSWFFFDDEVVALGADIHAEDGFEVLTVVENRKASETTKISGGEEAVSYEIQSATASAVPEAENVPENTFDGSYGTRWSAENDAWITWDLGSEVDLGYIDLAFVYGNERQTMFDLQISSDNVNWTTVYSGQSNGETDSGEIFGLGNQKGRYVRFYGHGNTVSSWNSISEAVIYRPNADGSYGLPELTYSNDDQITTDGGVQSVTNEDTDLEGTKWLHLEGTGGYIFPQGGALKARRTDGRVSFNELWFDHGINPQQQSYAYIILPGKTQQETEAYAQSSDVQFLVNDEKMQAVREENLKINSYVFWEEGSYNGVTVSAPLLVMTQEKEGELLVSVSDPTQKLRSVSVKIEGVVPGENQEGIEFAQDATGTLLTIQLDGSGASVQTKLKTSAQSQQQAPSDNESIGGSGNTNSNGNDGGSGSGGTGSSVALGGGSTVAGGQNEVQSTQPNLTDIFTHWAREDIDVLAQMGIVSGDPDGRFRPDEPVTRAEFITMMVRAFNIEKVAYANSFEDVEGGDWYADFIQTALEAGMISKDTQFRPNDNITRQEMSRVLAFDGQSQGTLLYRDKDMVADWAVPYVAYVTEKGYMQGTDEGNFEPLSLATRAQAAAVIHRMMKGV